MSARTAGGAARARARARSRGGNRLPPERYPARGPAYERSRAFGADRERRDRHQRARTRRAVAVAQTRGELPPMVAAVHYQLLELCTDTLLCPAPDAGPACSGWWSRRFIHDLIYPPGTRLSDTVLSDTVLSDTVLSDTVLSDTVLSDTVLSDTVLSDTVPPDGATGADLDDLTGVEGLSGEPGGSRFAGPGARTAGRWMAMLVVLGWVEVIHRHKVINGEHWGTSNVWRFKIPDHLRTELHAAEDASRARKTGRRPTGARPPGKTPRAPYGPSAQDRSAAAAAAQTARSDARRSHPCPACEGHVWGAPSRPRQGRGALQRVRRHRHHPARPHRTHPAAPPPAGGRCPSPSGRQPSLPVAVRAPAVAARRRPGASRPPPSVPCRLLRAARHAGVAVPRRRTATASNEISTPGS